MKKVLGLLLLFTVGCHNEPSLSVDPSQLVGTWNSLSISKSGKPYTRWTFNSEYAYILDDTAKNCQPLNNSSYYQYWLEKNILVTRYQGITNGLPTPDVRRPIVSITANEIILDTPHQVLERCP